MKTTAYILVILLLFSYCRKKKVIPPPSKQCNYSIYAFRKIPNNNYLLVEIDTLTGKSAENSDFPAIQNIQGCYQTIENCFYSVQSNNLGEIQLYRFDLNNKTTKVFPYAGQPHTILRPNNLYLAYNSVNSRFYCLYSYANGASYFSEFWEISISGNTFSYHKLLPNPTPDGMYSPFFVNESTGDMYFYSRVRFNKYVLQNNQVYPSSLFQNDFHYLLQYSKSDSMFYDFWDQRFFKINPNTEITTSINTLSNIPVVGYSHSTFDKCKNMYILQKGGFSPDSLINIYWLDINTGKVMKHLSLFQITKYCEILKVVNNLQPCHL